MPGENPTVLAMIPARAGSKRVRNKNIRPLGGHPLIAYSICAALESGIFQRVIVSTESELIADIARHYGAEVPFLRPAEYAGDKSPDIEWLHYTLRRLQDEGQHADCFSILRPTSPFRQPATIQRAWQTFLEGNRTDRIDSLRAVEKCTQHPGKMWVIRGNRLTPLLLNPPGTPWHSTPYQALPEVYVQNASLEIAWTRVVDDGTIAGDILLPFITHDLEGFDINHEWDWLLAEELLRRGEATLPPVNPPPYPLTQ